MWSQFSKTDINNFDIGSSTEPLVVNANNANILQKLWDSGDFDKVFNSTTHWTRITVIEGAQYEKDLVLRTIMSVCGEQVFPALYQCDSNDSFFLVQYCGLLIRKIILNKFTIRNIPLELTINLSITTNYLPFTLEPLNVNQQLRKALNKRYNFNNKTLDLTNFSQDEHLQDIYFCLNIPPCMQAILQLIKDGKQRINTLVLQHNDLQTLEYLNLKFTSLRELDLRHNKLTWEGYKKLPLKREMKLTKIWLDGNPLCKNMPESEYFKNVDEATFALEKIDGVNVSNVIRSQIFFKNFFHDGSWASFTDHFLHHYFGLMESANRQVLARMYHQKATFSLSTSFNPAVAPNWETLSKYMPHSRNLLTLSDITKAYSSLKTGPDEIMEVLSSLPALQFDYDSFTVDVPFSQKNELILIDVGGCFLEMNSGLFYFHRSFILTPFKKNPGEWKIETDMLSICPGTPKQTKMTIASPRKEMDYKMKLKLNPSIKDRDALIPAVCELTKLTRTYAIRFLEEGSWDLNLTLQAFIDQLKGNQIPLSAFSI